MTDTGLRPPEQSPAARRVSPPSWLDLRLVGGVVLVLAAVLLGAVTLASADHRQARWALSRDLAAGTVLTPADVHPVRVQLGSADSRYLPIGEAVTGRTLRQAGQAGELLSRAQLAVPPVGVDVTVGLRPENEPTIVRGDRITLWLSTKSCRAVVLLSGVTVQAVQKPGSSTFGTDQATVLVLRVSAADATRVVSAQDLTGAVIRAGILSGGQQPEPAAPDLADCAGTAT
ncbi:MAG TPA: SAF domain-containing protein [Jatrophihabitans sp.]|nr:SAF domain-containing protein [Jatrophihabitans sp.]